MLDTLLKCKYVLLAVFLCLVCPLILVKTLASKPPDFSLYFLDVGHGDSILIRYKEFDMFIDGGPGSEINYYLSKLFYPICNIDSILLTHPHEDHLSGLDLILEKCNVNIIFKTDLNLNKTSYTSWLSKTSEGSKVINLEEEDLIIIDDLKIYVIWPSEDFLKDPNTDLNNTSIGLFIDYYDFEAILLSDIESGAQEEIDIDEYLPLVQGKVDVLKFPHQGSKDALNKAFYDKISPKNVVLSVGDNSYGHPSKGTMDFLHSKDVKIYRTDENGTIKFKCVK